MDPIQFYFLAVGNIFWATNSLSKEWGYYVLNLDTCCIDFFSPFYFDFFFVSKKEGNGIARPNYRTDVVRDLYEVCRTTEEPSLMKSR